MAQVKSNKPKWLSFSVIYCIVDSVTLRSVYDCLQKVSHKWDDIGRELGVPLSYRKGLRMVGASSTNDGKLEEVLDKWIESKSTPVSWETVTDMLRKLDLNNIADEIQQWRQNCNFNLYYSRWLRIIILDDL